MFLVFIFLLWWSFATTALNDEALELLVDYFDGTDPKYVHNLLYGQMTFENFFGPNLNDKAQMDSMVQSSRTRRELLKKKKPKPYLRNVTSHISDEQDYNALAATVNNLTRRFVLPWYDPRWHYTTGEFKGYDDPFEPPWFEAIKKHMVENIAMQYLVHTRVKVYSALTKRQPFMHDKRYKMGYLFHRLRRILYDMAKVVSTTYLQEEKLYWLDLHTTLRWYRKAMRMDVDLRDTTRLITDLHKTPDPVWQPPTVEPPKKKKKQKGK